MYIGLVDSTFHISHLIICRFLPLLHHCASTFPTSAPATAGEKDELLVKSRAFCSQVPWEILFATAAQVGNVTAGQLMEFLFYVRINRPELQ